jgi:hypothetical protein
LMNLAIWVPIGRGLVPDIPQDCIR